MRSKVISDLSCFGIARGLERCHETGVEIVVYLPRLPRLPFEYDIGSGWYFHGCMRSEKRLCSYAPREGLMLCVGIDVKIVFIRSVEDDVSQEFRLEDIVAIETCRAKVNQVSFADRLTRHHAINQDGGWVFLAARHGSKEVLNVQYRSATYNWIF